MKRFIFSLWFIVYGLRPFTYAQDETLTLLTYYPAPYGVYQRLQVGSSYPSQWQSDISNHRHAVLTHNAYWNEATSTYRYSVTHSSFGARMITFQYTGTDSPIAPGQGIHFFEVAGATTANSNITWGDPELSIMNNLVVFDDTVQIGMGRTDPTGVLELARNSASTTLTISSCHNTEATSPILTFRKADNTIASPQPVDTNAILGTINFQGYDNDSFESGASIYAIADANWGPSERGAQIRFQTRDGNGNLTDRMTIAANGNVGINSTDPNSRLYVENTRTTGGTAVEGKGYFGVQGRSNSSDGIGVFGKAYNTEPENGYSLPNDSGNTGVFGAARQANGKGVYGQASFNGGIGVKGVGYATGGRFESSNGYGVYGETQNDASYAGYFYGRVAASHSRILDMHSGHLYDIAELIPCVKDVEYYDVVVINQNKDREVMKCTKENESAAGIISEIPQFCFGDREKAREEEPEKNWHFLALAGQIYCKVDASYGEIKRGDLLSTSPTPGHAMKAKPIGEINGYPIYPQGCIIGKALEALKEGKGKILVLVCLM